jgi:glycosyltransferase involved in cell wall biosynthesis
MFGEALASLAEQTNVAFRVLVLAHDVPDLQASDLVGAGDELLAGRIELVAVDGGDRARPLNVGLALARTSHVAFLDDDDVVDPDWVETFLNGAAGHPGMVIRAVTRDVDVESVDDPPGYAVIRRRDVPPERTRFDLIEHLKSNRSPICSFALPIEQLRLHGLTFDESLQVMEDYDLLMRAVLALGVHDTGKVTSTYRRWAGAEASLNSVETGRWLEAHTTVLKKLDAYPLHMPPGSVTKIVGLFGESEELRGRIAGTIEKLNDERRAARAEVRSLHAQLRRTERRLSAMERSTSWRVTAPLRAFARRMWPRGG